MKADLLIVDDDEEDILFIREAFSGIEGISVAYFSNTLSVISYLNSSINSLPSLIITDYKMPGLDGFNLTSFLKRNEKFRDIPLIILTGTVNEAERQRLIKAGVLEIFKKPDGIDGYLNLSEKLIKIHTSLAASKNRS